MKIVSGLLLVLALLADGQLLAAEAGKKSWEFSVSLDGSPIGYHNFELVEADDSLQVKSEASFDVRFLVFNAFKYRHTNVESWQGNCLERIESRTRQNGERFSVRGERTSGRFQLESAGQAQSLNSCISTFAYWDPRFLQQSKLLNPQSGEYVDVDVQELGRQEITVRGRTILASAYRVKARATELTVWYSDQDEWLGLESVAKGGRIIRYELT